MSDSKAAAPATAPVMTSPDIRKYEYSQDVLAPAIALDIARIKSEWKNRMDRAISSEADRTNNWSLLWKTQAAINSLRKIIAASSDTVRNTALQGELDDLTNESKKMFVDLKNWALSSCSHTSGIPAVEPKLPGLEPIASRVTESIVWPKLQPELFPVVSQMMLYGPQGSGKTEIIKLISYQVANALKTSWTSTNTTTSGTLSPTRDNFLTVLVVEGEKLKTANKTPAQVADALNSHLNCLQFELVQKNNSFTSISPIGLLVFDDADLLWMTDSEVAAQKRDERHYQSVSFNQSMSFDPAIPLETEPPSGFFSGLAAATEADFSGVGQAAVSAVTRPIVAVATTAASVANGTANAAASLVNGTATVASNVFNYLANGIVSGGSANTNTLKIGGHQLLRRRRLGGGEQTMEEAVSSVLNTQNLTANWPNIRVIWNVRYPWKLPNSILSQIPKANQLFVDLPSATTRRNKLKELFENELYKNLAYSLDERKNLTSELTKAVAKDDGKGDSVYTTGLRQFIREQDKEIKRQDNPLLFYESKIKSAIRDQYLREKKPTSVPPILVQTLINATPVAKEYFEQFMKYQEPLISVLTSGTGMSLEGYCSLESQLSASEVDMFMIVVGRKGPKADGFGGAFGYGFNIDDIVKLFEKIRAEVNTRLLHQALKETKSFFEGSETWVSEGCRFAASDSKFKNDFGAGSPDDTTLGFESETCKIKLTPNLTNSVTKVPVIPLAARYGSHRINRDDVYHALSKLRVEMKQRPTDYPQYVQYVLREILHMPATTVKGAPSRQCSVSSGPVAQYYRATLNNRMPLIQPQQQQYQYDPLNRLQQQRVLLSQPSNPMSPMSYVLTETRRVAGEGLNQNNKSNINTLLDANEQDRKSRVTRLMKFL